MLPEDDATQYLDGKSPRVMTVDEVVEWAEKNELQNYGIPDIIKLNHIDGNLLMNLTEFSMKENLGLNSYGARHNWMNAIKVLQVGTEGPEAENDEEHHYAIKDYGVGQYLEEIPLLESLCMEDRAKIGASVMFRAIQANELIVTQGQRQSYFYIIREGTCKVSIKDVLTGHIATVARLHSGNFFGEEGLVRQERAPATIIAECDVEVWCVNIKYTRSILRKSRLLKNIPHREAISAEDLSQSKSHAPQNSIRNKTVETRNLLTNALKRNCLFETIDPEQIDSCIEMMWKIEISSGETPIKQGSIGDYFYVIESGTFEILVKDDKGFTLSAAQIGPSNSFGELALMYNAPRAATVRALQDCVVWVLDRYNFRRILLNCNAITMQRRENFLRDVEILNHLLPAEISVLATACEEKLFTAGDIIFSQNETGDSFMIVEYGSVRVIKDDEEVGILDAGKFFGERSLLKEEPRAATIQVVEDVKVLFLNRHAFRLLLGPLHDILHRNLEEYEKAKKKYECEELHECPHTNIDITKLKNKAILGYGAFGEVRLLSYDVDGEETKVFALKKVLKSKIKSCGQKQHIKNERMYMAQMNCYFIVNLYATYESAKSLYFLMEPCLGGELFTYIRDGGAMEEHDAQIYIGCVVLAFEHMHAKKIIYRDLKPENLMVSDKGYLKVTDFGFAKQLKHRTYTLCGTPDYLAPEVISGKGHSYGVDWWTVGILTYELLYSFPPFYEGNHMKTYKRILREKEKYPSSFSSAVKLFISGLLQKKPIQRLGVVNGGIDRIINHRWFKGFDWDALRNLEMKTPIVPKIGDIADSSNFDDYPDKAKGRLSVFEESDFADL